MRYCGLEAAQLRPVRTVSAMRKNGPEIDQHREGTIALATVMWELGWEWKRTRLAATELWAVVG